MINLKIGNKNILINFDNEGILLSNESKKIIQSEINNSLDSGKIIEMEYEEFPNGDIEAVEYIGYWSIK